MPYLLAGVTEGQIGAMQTGNNDLYEQANEALIGRVNYSFADRYLLEAQFRYDGPASLPRGINGVSSLQYRLGGEYPKNLSSKA